MESATVVNVTSRPTKPLLETTEATSGGAPKRRSSMLDKNVPVGVLPVPTRTLKTSSPLSVVNVETKERKSTSGVQRKTFAVRDVQPGEDAVTMTVSGETSRACTT